MNTATLWNQGWLCCCWRFTCRLSCWFWHGLWDRLLSTMDDCVAWTIIAWKLFISLWFHSGFFCFVSIKIKIFLIFDFLYRSLTCSVIYFLLKQFLSFGFKLWLAFSHLHLWSTCLKRLPFRNTLSNWVFKPVRSFLSHLGYLDFNFPLFFFEFIGIFFVFMCQLSQSIFSVSNDTFVTCLKVQRLHQISADFLPCLVYRYHASMAATLVLNHIVKFFRLGELEVQSV